MSNTVEITQKVIKTATEKTVETMKIGPFEISTISISEPSMHIITDDKTTVKTATNDQMTVTNDINGSISTGQPDNY